jgi:4-amino-4-deoxy-L-arabinose transferase-like glycosyltransferase
MRDLSRYWPEAVLLLIAAILLFAGLGSHSIHNADEARYYIVVDEMMERGVLNDFTLRGEPYFNKAPLRIGMTHLLARVFGLSPWTLRIPSALMGLICVGLVLALGRRFHGPTAARWAALVFLGSTQWLYIHGARSGEMESTLLAFWLAALLAATMARRRSGALWWCAVLTGLAGLVKHLAYIAPVGATVLLWFVISGDLRVIGWRRLLQAGSLAVAITIPWHAIQILRHGMDFVDGYLGREVVERVASDYGGGYGWSFYLSVIKDGMFPWSLVLPVAVVESWRRRVDTDSAMRFLLVWIAFMIGGLMITQGDLSWYVMPALPALSLLVGWCLAECDARRGHAVVFLAIGLVLAVSPSNVMVWNVHERFAIEGLISGDLFGVVQGTVPWWPQVAVSGMMLIGVVVWLGGRARTGRQITLAVFAGFALVHAALPLRTAFTRSEIDLFSEDLATEPRISDGVVSVHPAVEDDSSVIYVHLERAAGNVEVVRDLSGRDPDRWCVIRREDLGDIALPEGSLVHGSWIGLPPEPR